ncbi:hypothetical protein Bca4012_009082 [Brassica carinata]
MNSAKPRDKLLGGILTADFDEESCLSRYQSSLYRKALPCNTPQSLVSKLRSYEKLHKRCGPGTDVYKEATKNLGHDDENHANKSVSECKYIVWVAVFGLGNRIHTLASVFLYALLTERVVLVDQIKDISDLFYEPFPDKVPWLIVKANVYFVPSLWFNPRTVFYHLVRYLFHPTNQVWGMVTRSYDAYLRADQTLGIQVRVFSRRAGYFQHVMDQIVACTQRETLLPELATPVTNTSRSKKLAVLVTSLYPEDSNNLNNMYWERPTSTGDVVQVNQPSRERFQQTDKKLHDQKALAEMYLLSLTDNIVTSAGSTFGYVAHSLGGLKPWLLYRPVRGRAPDPPCVRDVSKEHC